MNLDRDPYQVLGLTSAASQTEITRAYRRLLRLHHPDTRGPVTKEPAADEHLQQVLTAYALLRDPIRRTAYDHTASPPPPRPDPDPSRIRVRIVPRPARRQPGAAVRIGPVRWHH
ncbi:J domain-containing protein [Rhodococcus sp. NPDC056960]|uniref:J domain-containing protein n=1 Tax=Rhodococcus sp. NPDC056960 TaxID=3345982 RepID=UPI0036310C72